LSGTTGKIRLAQ